jgi:hypothetical protein
MNSFAVESNVFDSRRHTTVSSCPSYCLCVYQHSITGSNHVQHTKCQGLTIATAVAFEVRSAKHSMSSITS